MNTSTIISVAPAAGVVLLSGLLLSICWQDVRERQVSLFLLLLLLAGCSLRFFLLAQDIQYPLINGLFLLVQAAILLLYLLLRYRTLRLSQYLGAGDLLFWLACLWCFSPLNFVLFFVISLLGALLLHLVLSQLLRHYQGGFIPLAGFQGLFLIFALALDEALSGWSTFNDFTLLNALGLA